MPYQLLNIMVLTPAFKEWSLVLKASGLANEIKSGNIPLDFATWSSSVDLARELEKERWAEERMGGEEAQEAQATPAEVFWDVEKLSRTGRGEARRVQGV